MPNEYHNRQISDLPNPKSVSGVKPLSPGNPDMSMPERTANWPGLPGKAGPDRSAGVPEEKIYAYADGVRGGKEVNDGDA